MADTPLLTLAGTHLTFGGDALFEGADLIVSQRDRVALVGRNGSGKSTLLKIAAGLVEPDKGERFVQPGSAVVYLPQEPDFSGFETAARYIEATLGGAIDPREAMLLLEGLGVGADTPVETLSGGEARRVALVCALSSEADVLLLDEPTNHLDLPAIAWLENRLSNIRAAIVLISHDRRFLENLTTRTVWIDRGLTRSNNQGFSKFEAWRDRLLEEEETARHKLGRKIVAEEHWMRYGVTARRKRNMRRVAELQALRTDLREGRRTAGLVNMTASESGASGKRAIVADTISKAFGDKTIIRDFSIEITRGEKIGLVGPNGAGKTTLINLLTGLIEPDSGAVKLGTNLDLVTLDQRRASLKPDMRLADTISDGRGDWVTVGGVKKHVATYLQDFLFTPEQWRAPVSALSGGERGRLALAAALAKPSNLLVLDEPTNDLDLETLDLLEDLLASYHGTLLLVSHDRSFLDRIVTSVVTTDPQQPGIWRRYAGGYDDMVAQRGSAPGLEKSKTVARKISPVRKKTNPQKASPARLSYNDKYALETLPVEIADLESTIAKLKQTLTDSRLYDRDPVLFQKTAKQLEAREVRLAAAEDEWLALELKREGAGGA